jgi:hypothetical protein
MPVYVLRVWLPDRPGALGAVASRIGAVRADVLGIDVLERGADRAIDELVVELPTDDLLPLLVAEIEQVDGVDVEEVRPASEHVHDPRLDALESAVAIVDECETAGLLKVLAERAGVDFEADWVAVVDTAVPCIIAAMGQPPSAPWLASFLAGCESSAPLALGTTGPADVAWAALGRSGLSLVLGRSGRPFRERERRQLVALARIAEVRRTELSPEGTIDVFRGKAS